MIATFKMRVRMSLACEFCPNEVVFFDASVSAGEHLPQPDLPAGWKQVAWNPHGFEAITQKEYYYRQAIVCADHAVTVQDSFDDRVAVVIRREFPIKRKRNHENQDFIPLAPDVVRFNGGRRCDMLKGPCACGATHNGTEHYDKEFP